MASATPWQGPAEGRSVEVNVGDDGDQCVVRLRGRFEAADAAVCEFLVDLSRPTVVVDLSELASLDKGGVTALADARREAARRGERLIIVGARGGVRQLFDRMGMAPVLGH